MHLETLAVSDDVTVGQVTGLLEAAERHDGHVPLSDAKRLQLAHAGSFMGLVARDAPGGSVVGYAHLLRGGQRCDLEVVVHPERRDEQMRETLIRAGIDAVAGSGGGSLHLWLREPTPADAGRLAALGFEPGERLLQMRRPLGEGVPEPRFHEGTTLRAFIPGRDEEPWLEVNHIAFRTHPDQGGWTREQLEDRMAEPWFDREGFLIAEDAEGIAGFCWTKVHERQQLGEIYVIASHPSRQGQGLGRALVLAGLRSLARRGLPTGMLYTDAENEAAVHLYKTLGFEVHHEHRTFVRHVHAQM